MTAPVRVVFGMPAYNRPDSLARTLESLLSQTYRDFAIVIVDDKPMPEVRSVVDTYAALDPRLVYEANPVRLGMIGNWRKAFDRARAQYPESEYFAWVSDHDMWHPRWLEVLVGVLDERPQAAFAYPYIQRVYPRHRRAITRRFDTSGLSTPLQRLRAARRGMTAGNCIYGLFRARVLAQAGVFRPVLAPDRQILVQCLLFGEGVQVPEILWYREVAGMFSYKRQRQMFFPTGIPLHTYLPAPVQHFGVLLWELGIRGRGRPMFGRVAGVGYAFVELWQASVRELLRPLQAWWHRFEATRLGEWVTGKRSPRTEADADDEATLADVGEHVR
jgi:glycosyltransferase involved in cell wall biosynthesis